MSKTHLPRVAVSAHGCGGRDVGGLQDGRLRGAGGGAAGWGGGEHPERGGEHPNPSRHVSQPGRGRAPLAGTPGDKVK